MRQSETGVPKIFSIETRKKISLSKMGNKNPMFGKGGKLCPMFGRSGKLAPGSKPVICKNLKDNTIQEFDCIKNCAEFLGIRDTCLNSILRLRKKIKPKMRKKTKHLGKTRLFG